MPAVDYYRVLGLTRRATLEEVRRRYRVLALKHHPDRNPDDPEAAAQFRLVVEAYEAIQSSRSRRQARAENLRTPRYADTGEAFEEFFGNFGAEAPMSRSGGADLRYDLQVSWLDAMRGWRTVISVSWPRSCRQCRGHGMTPGTGVMTCPECQGRGRRYGGPGLLRFGPVCPRCRGRGRVAAHPCDGCGGQGQRLDTRHYQVEIPPGTEDGARLFLEGEGGDGFGNGPPGNLAVVIHVTPGDFFTRVGNDLFCQVEVSFVQAALGGEISIPTLDGHRTLVLPPGTQSGWTVRFPGAGAPGNGQRPRGDQVSKVVVTTPRHLYPRQRQLLEEWSRLEREGLG